MWKQKTETKAETKAETNVETTAETAAVSESDALKALYIEVLTSEKVNLSEWNAEKWASATDEEKKEAILMYMGAVYDKINLDIIEMDSAEFEEAYKETLETFETLFTDNAELMGEDTLQTIVDQASNAETSDAEAAEGDQLKADFIEACVQNNIKLNEWNAEKWVAATDEEKKDATLIYMEAVYEAMNTEILAMDSAEFAEAYAGVVDTLNTIFGEDAEIIADRTLQDFVDEAKTGVEETETAAQ